MMGDEVHSKSCSNEPSDEPSLVQNESWLELHFFVGSYIEVTTSPLLRGS